jgi:hypothetical protein
MQHADMPDWFLRLTVPSDPKFVETVRGLTAFVAGEARLSRDDVLKIGQAVDWVTAQGLMASAGDGRGIEVWTSTALPAAWPACVKTPSAAGNICRA